MLVKELLFAKAADNYVEIYTGGPPQLVRITLAKLEARLAEQGPSHARVHRSYLVGISHIRTIEPTGEGDVDIILANGARIPGSRRYRERISGLEAG